MIPTRNTYVPLPPSKLSFGYRRSDEHIHQGVDLIAPKGSPVVAIEPGIVDKVAREYRQGFSGYGRVVVIHGSSGRYFLYGHLQDVYVNEGQAVGLGQQIATVGNTAFTKEDPYKVMGDRVHLHFEVSPNRYPQDSEAERIDPVPILMEKKKATSLSFQFTKWGRVIQRSPYLEP